MVIAIGCNTDSSGAPPRPEEEELRGAWIALEAPSVLEPIDTATIRTEVYYKGFRRPDLEALVEWRSSDSSIATVEGGRVRARSVGSVSIAAILAGVDTASAVINVAWRDDATLRLYPELGTIEPGVGVQLTAYVRSYLPPGGSVVWSSSDAGIASVSKTGMVTGVSAGSATISASLTGLTASSTVRVAVNPLKLGFGYAYTGTAPHLEDYDVDVLWSPPQTLAFSTSGGRPQLTLSPPYPARPDFGWLRVGDVRPTLLLHAVSLEAMRCRAFLYVGVGFIVGAMTDCWDDGRSSNRFETIAATPDAFDGSVALIRPNAVPATSSGDSVVERINERGWREYYAPGFSRASSYTFVTAASEDVGGCAVAPNGETAAQGVAAVLCANRAGAPANLPFYAIVFGDGATRGAEARVFAELDDTGAAIRRSEAGISLTTTPVARGGTTVTLTGDAVAQQDRIPAVFLTAVSRFPQTRCWITEPTGAGTPRVTFQVWCDASANGVLVGATY